MRVHLWKYLMSLTLPLLCLPAVSVAQQATGTARDVSRTDIGKVEYEARCATCHGVSGKGDGPTAAYLTSKAPDLTTLTKRNNGIFPVADMYEVITGPKGASTHGTREMPVWGTAYRVEAGEHYMDMPYDPEAYVRARVLALIEYVSRLQEK